MKKLAKSQAKYLLDKKTENQLKSDGSKSESSIYHPPHSGLKNYIVLCHMEHSCKGDSVQQRENISILEWPWNIKYNEIIK